MKKPYLGSGDKTPPKEIMWKTFPHRLFFGREFTHTWGPGGVAFLNPKSNIQDKTYMCLYRITYVFLRLNSVLLFIFCFLWISISVQAWHFKNWIFHLPESNRVVF